MTDKDADIAADDAQRFIAKWTRVNASELSTSALSRHPITKTTCIEIARIFLAPLKQDKK